MKLYVHDYFVDYLGSSQESDEVWCDMSVRYSMNEDEDDPNVFLKSFSVYVGTAKGIGKYLQLLQENALLPPISFFRPILVVEKFKERDVYLFLKEYLENLQGKNERELIFRSMRNLDWVHDNPEIDDDFSYLLYDMR